MTEGNKEEIARLDPLQYRIQTAVNHKRFAASAADRIILDHYATIKIPPELLTPAFLRSLHTTVRLHRRITGHINRCPGSRCFIRVLRDDKFLQVNGRAGENELQLAVYQRNVIGIFPGFSRVQAGHSQFLNEFRFDAYV
ncbi:hypothetical protein D3C81_1612310 [compost metagenome]